ncbi:MAG: hypothetical protein DRI46_09790 [Chloroflexi bacterium]|nr:MAG: hypothetical protein DRI46_09790 [Chloroflexota bacterium]
MGVMYENFYPTVDDRKAYQLIAGARKDRDSYVHKFESKAGDMRIIPGNYQHIADQCNVEIQSAPMIKYPKHMDLLAECVKGARKLEIDLDDPKYGERLEYELKLIQEKEFQDYFKVVSAIIQRAKRTMLVGPGRGSSGGSLLCYLLGITAIDPLRYGLLFERFIDINRFDFPDIDTDYPDTHRKQVLKEISNDYGEACVKSLGTVLTLKAKSAINEAAMAIGVPIDDTEELKSSIIERSGGDARAAFCVGDTFTDLEIGQKFIEKHPKMRIASKIEGHAVTQGTHAAGVIISNSPLSNYCGVNSREGTLMIDGIMAEDINLLKVDCLGLRTLAVLMETAKLAKFPFDKYYKLDFQDQAVFDLLTAKRYSGIFQFDGQALGMVANQMGVYNFDDMIAITALSRPGALNSGGTARYVKRRTGIEEPEYFGDLHEEVTKQTYGVVVFQEQTMTILRKIGNMSWKDVNILRKAMSKSYGDEFFAKYKADFVEGAIENGHSEEEAEDIWIAVASMGSYGFNKSHAVAYAMISYWTAWAKAHHPLEFAAANLNHAKDDDNAVKILRDFVVNDGIKYEPFDADVSVEHWTIHGDTLIGGLLNLKGIGPKKAKDIIAARNGKKKMTPGMFKKLMNPVTVFDILFPASHYFGFLYKDPKSYGIDRPPEVIANVVDPGRYMIMGSVFQRDLRNRNDTQAVMRRGGKLVEDNIYYLNLYLEDDTDVIKCTIPPYLFDELEGQKIAESAVVGKTWFLVTGTIQGTWRNLVIDHIVNLNEQFEVKVA